MISRFLRRSIYIFMPVIALLLSVCSMAEAAATAEPEWNPSTIRECDRTCLVEIMDDYMNAMLNQAPDSLPPLSIDVPNDRKHRRHGCGRGGSLAFKDRTHRI